MVRKFHETASEPAWGAGPIAFLRCTFDTGAFQYGRARPEFQAGFFVSAPVAAAPRFESHHDAVTGGRSPSRCRNHAVAVPRFAPPPIASALQRQWYHGLPLEHAIRNIIFHYKIAPVCGILSGTETLKSEIHDLIRSPHVIGPPART
jgi:hypothetical protein